MSSAKEGSPSSPRKIKVNGQEIFLDNRPPLVLIGEPEDSNGYKCGPGVHLEGQIVVQNGNDWKSWDRASMGGSPVASSVEEPAVRAIILDFTPASELRI